MFGIPFTIRRFSEHGVEDELVFLRTRRRGEKGQAMREAIARYHQAAFAQGKAATRTAMGVARMNGLEEGDATAVLETILSDQEKSINEAVFAAQLALSNAEKVAELALEENYAGETLERLLDGFTDHELRAIVDTIELGAMPKDFFPSPGIPPKPNTITPSGTSQEKPSSMPATQEAKLKVVK